MFHAIKLFKNLNMIISIPDVIYFFYDVKFKETNTPNFYIPVNSCKVVWNKAFIIDNFICFKRDDFYNQIPYNTKVVLLGGHLMVNYDNQDIAEAKDSIKHAKENHIVKEWLNIFIKHYFKLLNSREDTGFTTLKENDIVKEWLNIFIKYYFKLLNSREDS